MTRSYVSRGSSYMWHDSFVDTAGISQCSVDDSFKHVTRLSSARHDSFICARAYWFMWSFTCVTCLTRGCALNFQIDDMIRAYTRQESVNAELMTLSYVWQDSFTCMTWLVHTRHDTFACVTIHTCDKPHANLRHDSSYVFSDSLVYACSCIDVECHVDDAFIPSWFDSFIRVVWSIYTWDTTYSYVWRDPFIRMTWLNDIRYDSFICVI